MAHRVPSFVAVVTASAALLAADVSLAGEPPVLPTPRGAAGPQQEARWPAELQHRNARYASLTRVDDPEGDLRVRLLAHMQTARVDDRVGDFEEVRRKRAAEHVPPRAVLYAQTKREADARGDTGEEVLASIRHERRFAETRRFRDLAGDAEELVAHQRAVRDRRLKQDDDISHATVRQTRRPMIDRREDDTLLGGGTSPRDLERVDEQEIERLYDDRMRDLGGGRDDDMERRLERAMEKRDREVEREGRDDDRDLERIEDANEKSADLREDRLLERQQELRNEREEANAPGGS